MDNLPTPGRFVHYWLNGKDAGIVATPQVISGTALPLPAYLPALVIESFGNGLTLQVFTNRPGELAVLRKLVPHQSEITSQTPYWLWPQITKA